MEWENIDQTVEFGVKIKGIGSKSMAVYDWDSAIWLADNDYMLPATFVTLLFAGIRYVY